jgi:hypothetical protein
MKTAVLVMTCPRPQGVSYLDETLRLLDQAGAGEFDSKLVVSDGPLGRCSWPSMVFEGPSDTRAARWRTWQIALDTGCDLILYCEDDISPCRNALRFIRNFPVAMQFAFVSFFEMYELEAGMVEGLHPIKTYERKHTRFFSGNQCLWIPRRTIEYLATCRPDDPEIPVDQWMRPGGSSDALLGWHLSRSPWPCYAAHMPSLVQHVGEVSTWFGEPLTRDRQAKFFAGKDFDAMTLASHPL